MSGTLPLTPVEPGLPQHSPRGVLHWDDFLIRVRVEVTAGDIAHGLKSDCQRCPIARALLLQFRDMGLIDLVGSPVAVSPTDVQVVDFGHRIWHGSLPEEAQVFIYQYDSESDLDEAEGFSFELTLERGR